MKVGVPKEVKNHEYRVALTPVGAHELVEHGHEVYVEAGAGLGSNIPDEEYVAAGATMLDAADDVWGTAEMVLKVKEPVAEEYHRLREDLTLFTYLHLAADKPLTDELLSRKTTAIAYETVQLPSGGLPLLYPMSEVAGCLAPQVGAHSLMRAQGGRGVLMGGVGGVANAKVVIIGAGVSGQNAANIALGMGADVTLLDTDLDKLRMSFWRYNNRVHGLASSALAIRQQVMEADMVIGAVLIPGAAAPKLVSNELVSQMKPGSVLVDIAVDQGGCFEDTRADHARRPDLHGPRLGLLLRGQHARRGAQHLDVRPDQRDHAVRRRAGRQGLGAGLPRRREPAQGPQHPRRHAHQRARGPGRGHRRRRPGVGAALNAPGLTDGPSAPTSTTSRWSAGWRPTPCRRTGATCGGTPRTSTSRGSAASTRSPRRPCRASWSGCGRATPTTRPLSSTSAARTVVAVRGFHKFAVSDGLATVDPASAVKPPTPAKRLPKALPLSDVEAILEASGAAGTPLALRDRALLEVLYGTGARISEAVGLDVDDLDTVDGTVLLRGKGSKERLVPDRRLRAGGRRRLPHPGPARPGRGRGPRAGRSSSTRGAAGSRARAPGRCWSRPPTGPA